MATQPSKRPATPAFVIDESKLEDSVDRFRDALHAHWPSSVLSYSFKTNSLPWLLAHLRRVGVWAEVVSDDEYELALALDYPAERIVYNGPSKSRELLRSALLNGSIVNLDAKREVTWAAELAHERPDLDVAVGLRINWNLEARCPGESTTGPEGSRFGFSPDNRELDDAIDELTSSGARVAGLHLHRNSATQSLEVYHAAATVAGELIASRHLSLDWVDIGGGFFGGTDAAPSFDDYVSTIRRALDPFVDAATIRLIVEPGGSLIAVPVEFHASVLDVKDLGDRRFVVTDASRTDLDPLFRRRRPLDVEMETDATRTHEEQILCGYTCMEDDRLDRLVGRPELMTGDRLIFSRVGAYTMSYQSTFIDFLPAVYARRDGDYRLVRRRWGVEDFLQGNYWDAEAAPQPSDATLPSAQDASTATSSGLSADAGLHSRQSASAH